MSQLHGPSCSNAPFCGTLKFFDSRQADKLLRAETSARLGEANVSYFSAQTMRADRVSAYVSRTDLEKVNDEIVSGPPLGSQGLARKDKGARASARGMVVKGAGWREAWHGLQYRQPSRSSHETSKSPPPLRLP